LKEGTLGGDDEDTVNLLINESVLHCIGIRSTNIPISPTTMTVHLLMN